MFACAFERRMSKGANELSFSLPHELLLKKRSLALIASMHLSCTGAIVMENGHYYALKRDRAAHAPSVGRQPSFIAFQRPSHFGRSFPSPILDFSPIFGPT